jgi:5-methyltetrahydropteroyltriglutamate--homocysteine methyltransferase
MIGCYVTGALPRSSELIRKTRAYERGRINKKELEESFEKATESATKAQISAGLDYITDGMLKWQDLFRPFTENLKGVKMGSLTRWFNNNTFYRKPIITDYVKREEDVVNNMMQLEKLPKNLSWKAILPAPYTFVSLSENQFYKDKAEFMFKFAEVINEEIKSLAERGFSYIQLSEPALVYEPLAPKFKKDKLALVNDVLETAVKGTTTKTCLQTFFGDFSKISPQALDFPVDHLGIDLYETDFEKLKEYSFEKGVALGLVDSRSSLVEEQDELVAVAEEIVEAIYRSRVEEVFICPNCDLDFLPLEKAEEKMKVISTVTKRLREEFP